MRYRLKILLFLCVCSLSVAENLDVLPSTLDGVSVTNLNKTYIREKADILFRDWETHFSTMLTWSQSQIDTYNQQMKQDAIDALGGFWTKTASL